MVTHGHGVREMVDTLGNYMWQMKQSSLDGGGVALCATYELPG